MALQFIHHIFTEHLLYAIRRNSYVGLLPGERIREHSQQVMSLLLSLTGRNVGPAGFKTSSRYVDRITISNRAYRPFIMPPCKES